MISTLQPPHQALIGRRDFMNDLPCATPWFGTSAGFVRTASDGSTQMIKAGGRNNA